jgi:hypothetical protein
MAPLVDTVLFLADQQRFDRVGYANGGHARRRTLIASPGAA